MPSKEELFSGFTIGDWDVLPGKGVLRRGATEVRPEPKVFDVLIALASRDGNLVTRDELVDEVWGGRATTDEPINRCLSQLRGHLDDRQKPHQYVETLQRRGYRLMQPVHVHQQHQDAPVPVQDAMRRPMAAILIGVTILAAALVFVGWYMQKTDSGTQPRSIAVLPIENLSGDPGNQYIVDGIKNVLANRLSGIPGLHVINARVGYDMEPTQIAGLLGVDIVLTGAAQLQGDTLKVTYLLARGRDNVTIGSGAVNGDLDGVFSLQQRLATAVRNELVGDETPELIKLYTPDSYAYNSFMRGMYALEHRDLEEAIALFEESIRQDEYYGPAYVSLATAYALLPRYRGAPVDEMSRLAIDVAEKGVALDENMADAAAAVYGSAYHQQKRWLESEAAYRRAVSARVVDSNAFNWYSRMLSSVGRLDDALDQALAAVAIDPDNAVINSRVATVYTYLGNSELAHEYFERAEAYGMSVPTHLQPYALLLARDGDFERARDMIVESSGGSRTDSDWADAIFTAFANPQRGRAALQALDKASAEGTVAPQIEVVARTWLGDVDGAMEVARRLPGLGEIFEMDLLFIPELQPLRDHPDFPSLLDDLGIVAYWQQSNCTWDGRTVRCPRD
ncbi:MAG: winged helix-turn-helix domain-containing protein [Gammaproteobacteria bacterium]|nr:winged helix-turn-helix domain-containing protein [Gammaproteobacteria bacterium]